MIPSFKVLPEGERPETEDPDESTVCRAAESDSFLTQGNVRWAARWTNPPRTWVLSGWCLCLCPSPMSVWCRCPRQTEAKTLADAVRYVAGEPK